MANESPNPVGLRVENFTVVGEEKDGDGNWVGSDMRLAVPPLGRFFLSVVTKKHFASEHLATTLDDLEQLERVFDEGMTTLEEKEPFVLNDEVITYEILHKKFLHRVIEADLAASLWFDGALPLQDTIDL